MSRIVHVQTADPEPHRQVVGCLHGSHSRDSMTTSEYASRPHSCPGTPGPGGHGDLSFGGHAELTFHIIRHHLVRLSMIPSCRRTCPMLTENIKDAIKPMTDAENRVARGAALLDEVADHNWREKLDVDTLESVQNACGCVAERVYPGGFGAVVAHIGGGPTSEYGFNSTSNYDDVRVVQAWKDLVHRDLSTRA